MIRISELIDEISRLKVLVVGEAMLDSYLQGPPGGICREAPVPIVNVETRHDAPGGAANTAVNVASLGAQVTLLSVIGADVEARLLRQALRSRGVNTEFVMAHTRRRTIAKHRVMADEQLLVRFDQGTTAPLDADTEAAVIEELAQLLPRMDAVIVSDYACGLITPRVVDTLKELQARAPKLLVADAKQLLRYQCVGVSAVKPNYREATQLLGLEPPPRADERADLIMQHGGRLLDLLNAQVAAVTLDVDGAVILDRGNPSFRTYGRRVPASRAAGAGDTFVSALTLALAAGATTTAAAEVAAAAAWVAVGADGTASCTSSELRAYFEGSEKFIADVDQLEARVAAYRAQGRRIVFTNGCFDILHRGHVAHLSLAKALGDVLIVGINSDASVRRLKGAQRPINGLEDRVQVLGALSCIDHIVSFDGDTASDLVRAIRPAVFVKGGDYTLATLPEAPLVEALGGRVHILPYLDDRSTTRVIERIKIAQAPSSGSPHDPSRALEAREQPAVR
jgi:D-beta-D-heptose 7-phosphate kinase/D-beta-D-heptose 1-phosphate adenosyltransferase